MKLSTFSIREVRRRPARALLTLLSIVLGVAAVVAVSASTAATRGAYQEIYRTLTGRAALEVVSDGGGSFEEGVLTIVESTPGVGTAVPILQRPTVVYLADDRVQVTALAVDPARDEAVRDYSLTAGSFFVDGAGVLLDADFARNLGIELNQNIRFLTKRGPREATVVGLLKPRAAAAYSQGGTIVLPLPAAQVLFRLKGKIDAVHIVLAEGADEATVLAEVERRLPKGLRVQRPAARSQLAEQTMLAGEQGLRMATALSLVVSLFLVLNTFLMNVGERRRQLSILRAIGATRRQIKRLLLGEGLILGAVGSGIGVIVGLAGARLLTKAMADLFQTAVPAIRISPLPCLWGIAFGMGVSFVATYVPARKAGKVSPLEGMSAISTEDREGPSRWMTILGLILVFSSALALGPTTQGRLPMDLSVAVVVLMMVGLALLTPRWLGTLSKVVSVMIRPLFRAEGNLARTQLLSRRVRSGLTAGVLFVAIGAGIGLGNAIMDNVRDIRVWYERTIVGDFFIRALTPDMATGASADMPDSLRNELAAIPGISHLDTVRFVRTEINGYSAIVIVREFASDRPLSLDLTRGEPETVLDQLAGGQAILGTVLAQRTGLSTGDEAVLSTPEGPKHIRIASMANDYTFGGLVLYVDRKTGQRLLNVEGVDAFIIQVDPTARRSVERALRDLCTREGLLLQSFAELASMIDGMSAGVVSCLYVLLVLGFVVAAFGIVNTLTMNVLEQTRELGILRIVAMTRRQVRKLVLAEALMLGIVGLAPGTLAGIGMAYVINRSMDPLLGHPIEFIARPELVLASLAAGLILVVAAALLPAERAARIDMRTALQYE